MYCICMTVWLRQDCDTSFRVLSVILKKNKRSNQSTFTFRPPPDTGTLDRLIVPTVLYCTSSLTPSIISVRPQQHSVNTQSGFKEAIKASCEPIFRQDQLCARIRFDTFVLDCRHKLHRQHSHTIISNGSLIFNKTLSYLATTTAAESTKIAVIITLCSA